MQNSKNSAVLFMFLQLSTSSYSFGSALGKSGAISDHPSSSWSAPYSSSSIFVAVTTDKSIQRSQEITNEVTVAQRNLLPRKHVTKKKCGGHSKSRYCRAYRRTLKSKALHKSALVRVTGTVANVGQVNISAATKTNITTGTSAMSTSDTKTGEATYYGTGLGACGITSSDTQMIAAASHILFDNFPGATANPNLNPICGRKVKATYEGASVIVEIVDRCVGCAEFDLDFSPSAFALIGPMAKGRLTGMTWNWV